MSASECSGRTKQDCAVLPKCFRVLSGYSMKCRRFSVEWWQRAAAVELTCGFAKAKCTSRPQRRRCRNSEVNSTRSAQHRNIPCTSIWLGKIELSNRSNADTIGSVGKGEV